MGVDAGIILGGGGGWLGGWLGSCGYRGGGGVSGKVVLVRGLGIRWDGVVVLVMGEVCRVGWVWGWGVRDCSVGVSGVARGGGV